MQDKSKHPKLEGRLGSLPLCPKNTLERNATSIGGGTSEKLRERMAEEEGEKQSCLQFLFTLAPLSPEASEGGLLFHVNL